MKEKENVLRKGLEALGWLSWLRVQLDFNFKNEEK